MSTFKVAVTRTYLLTIDAKNERDTKIYSEYYLGNCSDLLNKKDRTKKGFTIDNSEIFYNEESEINQEEE